MDYFTFSVIGGLAVVALALYLVGRFYPGSGADVIDWRPTRSEEVEAELEVDDVDQMLEAQNARRRRRGEAELTHDDLEARVSEDLREANALRRRYRADRERDPDERDASELLEATNARRRARGERELTVEELRGEPAGSPRRGAGPGAR